MILVTGATGTNGRELVQQLASNGQRVRALVRNPAKAANLQRPNVELFPGDFEQPAALDAALTGVDKAFLLVPVDERAAKWQTAFINAAKRANLKHLVKFSGMGAELQSPSQIMRQHAETDELLRKSSLPFTILQPNSFFQNMLWSAQSIKTEGAFYLPLKDAAQSLVDVRDINAIAAKVLTSSGYEGKTYVITGSEALTYSQVAEKLSVLLKRKINYVNVPPTAAEEGMRKAGMPEWNVRALSELYGVFASGEAASVTDTASRILNRPAISFDQFIRDHISVFQSDAPPIPPKADPGLSLEEMKAFVRNHFEEFVNRKQSDVALKNFSEDFIDHDEPGGVAVGAQAAKTMMEGAYQRWPDLHVTVEDILAEEDKVMVRNTWQATDKATRQQIEFHGFVLWRFAKGKIVERWATLAPPKPIQG